MSRIRRWHKQKGGAAVEFAIVLPLLAAILFGIIEFSILLYNKQVITNASREGARAGIVSQSPRLSVGDIQSVVDNYCATYLITFSAAPASPVTSVGGYAPGALFGTDLTVSVAYNYTFLSGLVYTTASPFVITAQTVMRYE